MRLDWDRVLAAWALVLVLILGCSAAVQPAHQIDRAEASSALRGVKTPQRDSSSLARPAYENDLTNDRIDD